MGPGGGGLTNVQQDAIGYVGGGILAVCLIPQVRNPVGLGTTAAAYHRCRRFPAAGCIPFHSIYAGLGPGTPSGPTSVCCPAHLHSQIRPASLLTKPSSWAARLGCWQPLNCCSSGASPWLTLVLNVFVFLIVLRSRLLWWAAD
jgi:hypothetical protein